MTTTGIPTLDHAPQVYAEWLNELCDDLGWTEKGRAHMLLRETLHAVRDFLPVEEAVDLAARLLVPLALVEERMTWHEYHKMRHSGIGTDIKGAARRLIGDAEKERKWTRRVLHQQGLLQVDQDFGLEGFSSGRDAVYGEQLQQWK